MTWEKISSNTVVTEVVAKKVRTTEGLPLYFHKQFVNGEYTGCWFADSKKNYFKSQEDYCYASIEFLELIRERSIGSLDTPHYKIMWEDLESCELEIFDATRVCRLCRSSDLVFQYGKEAPLSSVLNFNYIGGIATNYFDVDAALKHLKDHPNILKCSIEGIPYYNRENDFTRAIHMSVLLPQEDTDVIWDFYKNDKYPSCRLKDAIVCRHKGLLFDPLNIKQFLLDKNE